MSAGEGIMEGWGEMKGCTTMDTAPLPIPPVLSGPSSATRWESRAEVPGWPELEPECWEELCAAEVGREPPWPELLVDWRR